LEGTLGNPVEVSITEENPVPKEFIIFPEPEVAEDEEMKIDEDFLNEDVSMKTPAKESEKDKEPEEKSGHVNMETSPEPFNHPEPE